MGQVAKDNVEIGVVLQGGGALGAYEFGAMTALLELMDEIDIPGRTVRLMAVTGVSIGAINAALIAGNRAENRIPRLREFWDRVSSGIPLAVPAPLDWIRVLFNRWSASASMAFGVPGFFSPRFPSPLFAPPGAPGALSLYDTAPLLETLRELVDFDVIKATRYSLGGGMKGVPARRVLISRLGNMLSRRLFRLPLLGADARNEEGHPAREHRTCPDDQPLEVGDAVHDWGQCGEREHA